jgi:hypothetical protein
MRGGIMRSSTIRALLLATAFALAGCGGGGGGGIASTPPPPPPPPPPPSPGPAIIVGATTSQQFAVSGASLPFEGDQSPRLGAGEQLQVRYVQSSNSYEVQLPQSQTWAGISYVSSEPGSPAMFSGNTATVWLQPGTYQYSRLLEWSSKDSTIHGYEAIGMGTPAGGVPLTGSASYLGRIAGYTSEYQPVGADDSAVDGSIRLLFDFGLGTLSGSISPNLHQGYAFGSLDFRETVYSTGSTTFSGMFDTDVAGLNSFSGQFTGPKAEELIGNFVFPYRSPVDGKIYQADGAFVGTK